MSERLNGVVVGLVKDIDDPVGEGRVRVQFPWLPDEGEPLSGWAPIVRTMAGKERGFYYMPELEDEALVAFEHGDVDHPYVVGFLHNGVDLPPDDDIDFKVRRVKTVSGHILEFDDRGGKERIELKTQGGHHLVMEDAPGTVTLESSGGQKLVMEDVPAKVTLSTTGGTSIEMSDAPSTVTVKTMAGVSVDITDAGGVTVNAPTGSLSITCLNATITASAACSVTAATISFNSGIATFSGVVQCSALITQAVVSQAYTPGAGNIW
jgi:uncharacterized protein involved in type VI secretion and phage assembly